MLKVNIELSPGKVERDIAKYATCLGPVRLVPMSCKGKVSGLGFYVMSNVQDPQYKEVYLLVHVKGADRGTASFYVISHTKEIYRLSSSQVERDSEVCSAEMAGYKYDLWVENPQTTIPLIDFFLVISSAKWYAKYGTSEDEILEEFKEADIPF